MAASNAVRELAGLWVDVLVAYERMWGEAADAEDRGAFANPTRDLLGWADDQEDRLGRDVSDFRPALRAYCVARRRAIKAGATLPALWGRAAADALFDAVDEERWNRSKPVPTLSLIRAIERTDAAVSRVEEGRS